MIVRSRSPAMWEWSYPWSQRYPEFNEFSSVTRARALCDIVTDRRKRLTVCPRAASPPYLYPGPHANGSCETSQTFFPTLTFYQSARGTRGPDGGRLVVGAAPLVVWLSSGWPMARGRPGLGHEPGLPSVIPCSYTLTLQIHGGKKKQQLTHSRTAQ